MGDRAEWIIACGHCHTRSPDHAEGCPHTPVTLDEHRRKLLAELSDPQWLPMARARLLELEHLAHPKVVAAPGRNTYEHRDGTRYTLPGRTYWVGRAGPWYLTPEGELVDASPPPEPEIKP